MFVAQSLRLQVVAARFMEQIGILCDLRFAALSSEPGGKELIAFHYDNIFANHGIDGAGLQDKLPANTR